MARRYAIEVSLKFSCGTASTETTYEDFPESATQEFIEEELKFKVLNMVDARVSHLKRMMRANETRLGRVVEQTHNVRFLGMVANRRVVK